MVYEKRFHAKIYSLTLSVRAQALGCAMWDGGVVLTRIVYENAQVFRGARVLELGSGCGLTGLVCARFAESVVLTDYIVKVVENLEYNVALNSRNDDSDCDSGSDSDDDAVSYPSSVDSVPFRKHIASVIRVGPLDWDRVGEEGDGDATTTRQVACTAVAQSTRTSSQPWQHCATCFPSDPDCGCCVPCAISCHRYSLLAPPDTHTLCIMFSHIRLLHSGHTLGEVQHSRFRCDCYESDACHLSAPPNITLAPHSASVILGAELIYSLLAIDSLVRTISRFLSPDGIFYHLLSQDRDVRPHFNPRITRSKTTIPCVCLFGVV